MPTAYSHRRRGDRREAGLVTVRRRGTQICYSLEPGSIRSLQETLGEMAAVSLKSA